MKKFRIVLLLVILLFLLTPFSALAQTYLFRLDRMTVHVFWNEDGTSTIHYKMVFTNDPSASPIDFVDVGVPTYDFSTSNVRASVDGQPLDFISKSEYMGSGSGVAVGLEEFAIPPGQTGTVGQQPA